MKKLLIIALLFFGCAPHPDVKIPKITMNIVDGEINSGTITLKTENIIKDGWVFIHPSDAILFHKPVFQIPLNVVFYSEEKCFLETSSPNNFDHNLKFINGKFDISSWVRPLNIAFEIQNIHQKIQLKRNEIIGELIFHTSKINKNIILEENNNPSSELLSLSQENTKVSSYIKNTKTLISKGKQLLQRLI